MIDPLIPEASVSTNDRTLRQFAGLWILAFGGLALWQGLAADNRSLALVFLALSLVIGLLGLARPQAIRPLFSGLMAITYPIGWVVSHLLLGVLFYGMFMPIGMLFRLIGRDALDRRKPSESTYWHSKATPRDVRSYFRQS